MLNFVSGLIGPRGLQAKFSKISCNFVCFSVKSDIFVARERVQKLPGAAAPLSG